MDPHYEEEENNCIIGVAVVLSRSEERTQLINAFLPLARDSIEEDGVGVSTLDTLVLRYNC